MFSCGLFFIGKRNGLRNKFSFIFAIVIWPSEYFRNLPRPVSVSWVYWCCPFQRICLPGVKFSNFSPFKNAIEEIVIVDKSLISLKGDLFPFRKLITFGFPIFIDSIAAFFGKSFFLRLVLKNTF